MNITQNYIVLNELWDKACEITKEALDLTVQTIKDRFDQPG